MPLIIKLILMVLLVGSAARVQIGAWICRRLHAKKLQQYFAAVVILAVILVAASLAGKIV